ESGRSPTPTGTSRCCAPLQGTHGRKVREMDEAGSRRPEPARTLVERHQLLAAVDVQPLASGGVGFRGRETHHLGRDALVPSVDPSLGAGQNGGTAPAPGAVHNADHTAVSKAGSPPTETERTNPVPPTGPRFPAV